jgi:hypothetical protein
LQIAISVSVAALSQSKLAAAAMPGIPATNVRLIKSGLIICGSSKYVVT